MRNPQVVNRVASQMRRHRGGNLLYGGDRRRRVATSILWDQNVSLLPASVTGIEGDAKVLTPSFKLDNGFWAEGNTVALVLDSRTC